MSGLIRTTRHWAFSRWVEVMDHSGLMRYNPVHGVQNMGHLWVLTKGRKRLVCALHTHPTGWELRVWYGPELVRSQVCKTQDDVFFTAEKWKATALTDGWALPPSGGVLPA